MPDLRHRLAALERNARHSDRMTEVELSAGVARYRVALGEGGAVAGILSADQFATMLRQMPAWMARTFALSVDPLDMML